MKSYSRSLTIVGTLTLLAACGDSGSGPGGDNPSGGGLDFDTDLINLFDTRSTSVTLVNGTGAEIGPVAFGVGATFDERNIDVGGVRGTALPPRVPVMRPGEKVSVSVNLNESRIPSGFYESVFEARVDGQAKANVRLRFEVGAGSTSSAVSIQITDGPAAVRQGDPVDYIADTRNSDGEPLPPGFVEWYILPTSAGGLSQDGRFVPYTVGPARIIARSGTNFDTLNIDIAARNAAGSLQPLGRGQNSGSQDLSVMDDFVYLATSAGTVETWRVTDPTTPVLTSTLALDASRVPTVHIRGDGQLGAAGHFGSADGLNGVTLFDLTDPSTPAVTSRFTEGLSSGVEAVLLQGDLLYVAVSGSRGGIRVIDVSDPAAPLGVGAFAATESFATDLTVQDGLLYVAYWNAGVIVLDVGNGVAGGSPANPTRVSSFTTSRGQIGSISLWSAKNLAFLREADDRTPGVVHLMDTSDLMGVFEVGSWGTPELAPGPVAVDSVNQRLFAAWSSAGVRMLDATGTLEGEMERQGREVAVSLYDGPATNTVRIRVVGDLVFVADGSSGLIILRAG
jgi:hypothetical protein